MDHVAFMKKSWGLIPKILAGQKTIESRWYMHRCAPWDKITAGDIVYFKNSGEAVTIRATASKVEQISGLSPTKVKSLLMSRAAADGIEESDIPKFAALFKEKKYCMLIHLRDVKRVAPFHINKTGFGKMSAWICVDDINKIRMR